LLLSSISISVIIALTPRADRVEKVDASADLAVKPPVEAVRWDWNPTASLLKGIVVFAWILLTRLMTQAVLASCPPVL